MLAAYALFLCYCSPAIRYLAAESPGEWIVSPMSIDVRGRHVGEQKAVFSRSFSRFDVRGAVALRIRACESFSVLINTTDIGLEPPPNGNWKQPAQIDVARYLKQGENQISVIVVNSNGPPALWLSMTAGDWSLASDAQWQVSQDGAPARAAAAALAPIESVRGDLVSDAERPLESLVACRWTLLLFGAISCIVVGAIAFCEKRLAARLSIRFSWHWAALMALAVLWLCLFCNNSPLLNSFFGFDYTGHVDYIDYVQKHRAVPLADEGWEMYQPPLYYAVSALSLQICGLSVEDEAAVNVLRFESLLMWGVRIVLILAILRLIFPKQARPQQIGLLLAAFVPVQIYMFQYVANEPLTSVFGVGAIYLALRMLLQSDQSLRLPLGLGVCLGAALLTKVTAGLLVAVVTGALAVQLVVERRYSARAWLRTVALPLAVCLAVSGWYYVRVWRHFGTPMVTNMSVESGFAAWSAPGYSYAGYFLRFGRSLASPFFGGFYSAADGLYSTLWGDGTWGGVATRFARPPWNYQLMATGYFLALAPTIVVLTGMIVALARFVRQPQAEWLLLLGLAICFLGAEVCFCLYHPNAYSFQARFGLTEMAAFCALGGVGFDFLAGRSRIVGFLLAVLLCTWALTAYTSFWIVASAPETLAWRAFAYFGRATDLLDRGRFDEAIAEYRKSLKLAPDNAQAHSRLGDALLGRHRLDEAVSEYRKAAEFQPGSDLAHNNLANALAMSGDFAGAMAEFRRVLEIEPDHAVARFNLGNLLAHQGRRDEALAQYRTALRLATAQNQPPLADAIRDRMRRLTNLRGSDGGLPR